MHWCKSSWCWSQCLVFRAETGVRWLEWSLACPASTCLSVCSPSIILSSAPPTPLTSLVPTFEYYKLVRSLMFCRYASVSRHEGRRPREYSGICARGILRQLSVVISSFIIRAPWLCRENIYNSSKYCVTPQNYSVIPRGHSAMHHAGGGDQLCFGRVIYYSCRPIQYLSSHYEMSSAEHKHNAHWASPFLTMGRRINIFVQTI